MADVIHLINGTINNGTIVTAVDMLGNSKTVAPVINQTDQVAIHSGIMDTRLDDIDYYRT